MPKIRREKLPERLLIHLLARVRQRSISYEHLILLAHWLDTEPEVPAGRWFKRFPGFTVCGEGELIRTFLLMSYRAPPERVGPRGCAASAMNALKTVMLRAPMNRRRTFPAASMMTVVGSSPPLNRAPTAPFSSSSTV